MPEIAFPTFLIYFRFNISSLGYNSYSTVEHMGTHMDAPYHLNRNGLKMDEVPLADLMGPLVKIDITERARYSTDAEITIEDILKWEDTYGNITERSYVLMSSGWDEFYGEAKYLGAITVCIFCISIQ